MRKRSSSAKAFTVFNYSFLSVLGMCFVLPYVLILVMSFTSTQSYYHKGYSLFPESLTLEGYKMIFGKGSEIYTAFFNTVVITVLGTVIGLFCTVLAAYALSRKRLAGRKFFNGLIVFAMLFSGGLIPSFLLIAALNMLNTYWSIVVPGALTPWYCILVRTYFTNIPDSLEESARMDGANDFLIMLKIYLPLALPVVATVSLYFIVGFWNQWSASVLYFDGMHRNMMPIAVILREYIQYNTQGSGSGGTATLPVSMKMATVVVATLPIVCIYPFLQKFFINGLMVGSVKG